MATTSDDNLDLNEEPIIESAFQDPTVLTELPEPFKKEMNREERVAFFRNLALVLRTAIFKALDEKDPERKKFTVFQDATSSKNVPPTPSARYGLNICFAYDGDALSQENITKTISHATSSFIGLTIMEKPISIFLSEWQMMLVDDMSQCQYYLTFHY